jgi:hypothetical protein
MPSQIATQIKDISRLFKALSNEKTILLLLNRRRFLHQKTIANRLGISRIALYKHSKRLIRFRLEWSHGYPSDIWIDDGLANLFRAACELLNILGFANRFMPPAQVERRWRLWLELILGQTIVRHESAGERIALLKRISRLSNRIEAPKKIASKRTTHVSKRRYPSLKRFEGLDAQSRWDLERYMLLMHIEFEFLRDVSPLLLRSTDVRRLRKMFIHSLLSDYGLPSSALRGISRCVS